VLSQYLVSNTLVWIMIIIQLLGALVFTLIYS